ncbi:MAG: hypothetical protein IPN66_16900 [Candidatus Competibacteraceae bacterium]|nr:hypothetical protein [Candidatus Competibacteraceae bacterium]
MDIVEYLRISRETNSIWTSSDHPDILDGLYVLYDELNFKYDLDLAQPFELILIQTPSPQATQIVELDGNRYVVLEMTFVSHISQLLEIFTFQRDPDQQTDVSIFLKLWLQEKYAEITGTPKGMDIPIAIKFITRGEYDIDEELKNELCASPLLEHLVELEHFKVHFQIYVSFIIFHELAHYEYKRKGIEAQRTKVLHTLKSLPFLQSSSPHFDSVIEEAKARGLSDHQIEELYCDYVAINGAWRHCVEFRWIDRTIFGFSIPFLYSTFYHLALASGIFDSETYYNLKVRQAYAISHSLYLISLKDFGKLSEKEQLRAVMNKHLLGYIEPTEYHRNFEHYVFYLTQYLNNISLYSARVMRKLDVSSYRSAVKDLLKIDISEYDDDEIENVPQAAIPQYLLTKSNQLLREYLAQQRGNHE